LPRRVIPPVVGGAFKLVSLVVGVTLPGTYVAVRVGRLILHMDWLAQSKNGMFSLVIICYYCLKPITISNSMKEITLKVPDHKVDFVMELIEQLGLDVSSEPYIPEEHKTIVRERIKNSNPEDLIPWEKARKQFTFKDKS